MKEDSNSEILIVYDGECPVCSHYVSGIRLREAAGQLKLQNAREVSEEVAELKSSGYDLNRGMIVKIGDTVYYGADGMHALSMMTTPSHFFNRCVFLLFRSPSFSRLLYPVFRNLRFLLLKILRIKPIDK
jgi:predicted DCC family thiol-disulfide oxidoreductase YuxK